MKSDCKNQRRSREQYNC